MMHSTSQQLSEINDDTANGDGDITEGKSLRSTQSVSTPAVAPTPTTTAQKAVAAATTNNGKIPDTATATSANKPNTNTTLTKTQSLRSSIPSFIPTSQIVKLSSKMNRLKDLFSTPTASSTNLAGSVGDNNKSLNDNGDNLVFKTAKESTTLFPPTNPQIDGEECLHDCDSCTVSLPRKWDIDNSDELYGHVKGWDYHVIVGTGKADWVRDVVDEKGSLMESLGIHGLEIETVTPMASSTDAESEDQQQQSKGGLVKRKRVMLSASNMPTGGSEDGEVDASGKTAYSDDGKTNVIVLPGWKMVEGVTRNEVGWLMNNVVGPGPSNLDKIKTSNNEALPSTTSNSLPVSANTETNGTSTNRSIPNLTSAGPQNNPHQQSVIPPGIKMRTLQHRALILMCSHKTRDARCGQSAPLLRRELERHLRPLGLYRDIHDDRPGGVGIYFINHVGGHKYSANVMVYRRQGSNSGKDEDGLLQDEAVQGIWLARVRPEDCENIVRYTVLQGKVVKPASQLRGGFDRGSGVASW